MNRDRQSVGAVPGIAAALWQALTRPDAAGHIRLLGLANCTIEKCRLRGAARL